MTSLNRNSSSDGLSVATRPHPRSQTSIADGFSDDSVNLGQGMNSCWDDLLADLPSPQHRNLFLSAQKQGLLKDCFETLLQHPVQNPPEKAGPGRMQFLDRLLSDDPTNLEPLPFHPLILEDCSLDPPHKDLLCSALNSPDIFLIQKPSQFRDQSHLISQIIVQAVRKGLRVLHVARKSRALDAVLEKLVSHEEIFAFRCLFPRESLEDLPASIRGLTFLERSRVLRERAWNCATNALKRSHEELQKFQKGESVWPRILTLFEHGKEVTRQQQTLQELFLETKERVTARKDDLLAESNKSSPSEKKGEESHPFSDKFFSQLTSLKNSWHKQAQQIEEQIDIGKRKKQDIQKELDNIQSQFNPIRPLYLAKKNTQWWSFYWWLALFRSVSVAECQEWERQEKTLLDRLQEIERAIQEDQSERMAGEERFVQDCEEIVQAEIETQRKSLEKELQGLDKKMESLQSEYNLLFRQIGQEEFQSEGLLDINIRDHFDKWQDKYIREKEKNQFLQEWQKFLQESGNALVARLPKLANLVSAPLSSLPRDKQFGDWAKDQTFDLLILDDAHTVNETEFLKLASRAHRWILLGIFFQNETDRVDGTSPPSGRNRSGSPGHKKHFGDLPSVFCKLWEVLYGTANPFQKQWIRETNRFCCRMIPVSESQRDHLESEFVADRPDIELRILNVPQSEPVIAEICFSQDMSLQDCKQFLFAEMEEVVIQGKRNFCFWKDEENCIRLDFSGGKPEKMQFVDLAPGIRELVECEATNLDSGSTSQQLALTHGIEFVKQNGWNLEKAVEWVKQNLNVNILGRTACL